MSAGHWAQVLWPEELDVKFTGHGAQAVDPAEAEKLPAGHGTHAARSGEDDRATNDPAGQADALAHSWFAALNWPERHDGMHASAPRVVVVVPAGQSVQFAFPVDPKVDFPIAHGVQLLDPAEEEKVPCGHGWHKEGGDELATKEPLAQVEVFWQPLKHRHDSPPVPHG